jgi:hypothetical protein
MDLEHHHIINFLRIKCLKLGEIGQELSRAYGPIADTPTSIQYWLHYIRLGRTDLRKQYAGDRPPLDDIDAKILSLFRKYPFSSVRTIAKSLKIPLSINLFSFGREIWSYKFLASLGSPYISQRVAAEACRTVKSVTPDA